MELNESLFHVSTDSGVNVAPGAAVVTREWSSASRLVHTQGRRCTPSIS